MHGLSTDHFPCLKSVIFATMPDAGTAFDGSTWVAGTSAVGLGELRPPRVNHFLLLPHDEVLVMESSKMCSLYSKYVFVYIFYPMMSDIRGLVLHAVVGSAAVTALGATFAAIGLSRLDDEAMLADDAAELEATAAADQASKGSEKGDDTPQQGRERIKRS